MGEINVYWLTYHDDILARGYYDQGLLEEIFAKGNFKHHMGIKDPCKGGVVIINGRTHVNDTDKINKDLEKLGWCVFIDCGDEEALFPIDKIKHTMIRKWVMLPRMNQHNDVYRLPQGYRPETPKLLKEIGYKEKTQDWFFCGQITHERRFQCRDEIAYLNDSGRFTNGTMVATCAFAQEKMPYQEYLENMAKTKIVFCPSGPETPDSFRLYEALEAGCVPVVDAFSTNNKVVGFWQYLFGDHIPFPIVDYWDKLPILLPELLRTYPELSVKCFAWWQQQKKKIEDKLYDDIKEINR